MTSCLPPKLQNASTLCQYFPSCGGCDFLDLDEENYRQVKIKILHDLIKNYITSEPEWIWIKSGSRRRIIFQIDQQNQLGFFTKNTNLITKIESCFVAEKDISNLIPTLKTFLKTFEQGIITQIATTLFDNGLDLVFIGKKALNFSQIQKTTTFAKIENLNISYRIKNDLTPIFLHRKNQIFYKNLEFKLNLNSDIFIQATKSGLEAIINICRNEINHQKKIIDIYSGFGAYTFAIQDLSSTILAVEGDENMVNLIKKNAAENNLSNKIKAETHDLFSSPIKGKDLSKFDIAIINPPRNGASPQIIEISKSSLEKIIYVSCNPQTFLRDAKILIDSQFKITKLYALDQFYGTNHLELIGIFEKNKI